MINYRCYNIKAEAKFCLAEQGFVRCRRGGHCYFGLKKDGHDPVMLFHIFSFTHLFTILGLILSAYFIIYQSRNSILNVDGRNYAREVIYSLEKEESQCQLEIHSYLTFNCMLYHSVWIMYACHNMLCDCVCEIYECCYCVTILTL